MGLLGPVFARGGAQRNGDLGIDGATGDAAVRALRRALEVEGRLTRAQVRRRLEASGVVPDGQAPVHVLRRAAMKGVLCVVAGPRAEEGYELLDGWIPAADPIAPDEAAAGLARRYLAGYGPVTPTDFAAWSGLGLTMARRAWADMGSELAEVDEPRGHSWVLHGGRGAATTHGPVRLLGGFDNMLLGYADRSPVLARQYARKVNVGGGMVRPVVVADGRVVATWRSRRDRGRPRVEVTPFDALPADVAAGVEEDLADVGRFLGTSPVTA